MYKQTYPPVAGGLLTYVRSGDLIVGRDRLDVNAIDLVFVHSGWNWLISQRARSEGASAPRYEVKNFKRIAQVSVTGIRAQYL